MEKKRYEVTIAEVELSIISDEREDFVMRLVNNLDSQINEIILKNKRSSKMDAALLCALDYNCERIKAEKRVRNLEAQIALYDANLRRMREENIKLRKMLLDGGKEVPVTESASVEIAEEQTEAENGCEEKKKSDSQMTIDVADTSAAEETSADGREDKLRQIADLFHRSSDSEKKPESAENTAKAEKLGAIEELLKSKRN